jgi:hypothetical protein
MMLQDMENEVLSFLQQSELVNFGGAPLWSTATNAEFNQALVDYQLNRAYIKVYRDISDIDVAMYDCTFPSVAQQGAYALNPPPLFVPVFGASPNPPVAEVRRVFYAPVGLGYNLEFAPGARLLPWKEYQKYTASGYFNQFSYGTQPEICTVTPDRTQIVFFPSPANQGDIITLQYSPVPTVGSLVPLMSGETYVPPYLPDDFQELIPMYAIHKLLPKARATIAAKEQLDLYYKQLEYTRAMWKRRHGADQQRFTDVMDDRAASGPFGWW